jgi:hypothetical protein
MGYSDIGLVSEWLESSILFKIDIFNDLLNRKKFADLLAEQMIATDQKDAILNVAHDWLDKRNKQLKDFKERMKDFKL